MERHLPTGRLRTSSVIAAWLLAGTIAACSTSSAAKPETIDYDFFGVVQEAAIDAPSLVADDARTYGGPSSDYLVGPGTLTLFGGPEFEVPADTPGPETCLSVDAEGAVEWACLVIGALRQDGRTVEWLGSWPVLGAAERVEGRWRARFELSEVGEEAVLVQSTLDDELWFEVPLAATVTNRCVRPVADVPREEFAASLPVAASYEVLVDLDTTTVISVDCFYVD